MKKGISLIVLVITIIVIIILAGAVILSLANNNPIAQAEQATKASDVSTIQSAVTLFLSKLMAENKGVAVVTPGASNALLGAKVSVNGVEVCSGISEADLGFTTLPNYGTAIWTIDNAGTVGLSE